MTLEGGLPRAAPAAARMPVPAPAAARMPVPAPAARHRPLRPVPGPIRFARYAYGPNRLGYCGPEEAQELGALAGALSEEDLLRGLDLLTRAEGELRNVTDPRVALDLVLLKLVQMRRLVPFAVQAWDGANGERGLRMSLSSWSYVVLDAPAPVTAYLLPLLAVGLVALAEWGLLRRVKRQEIQIP